MNTGAGNRPHLLAGDTDANNDAMFIHEFDLHYKRNRLGSAKEYGDK